MRLPAPAVVARIEAAAAAGTALVAAGTVAPLAENRHPLPARQKT